MDSRLIESEALIDLVDRLRDAGFNIGARHYVAAHELVVRLLAQNVDLASPERLSSLLRPLFCSKATEQDNFEELFEAWSEAHADIIVPPQPIPKPGPTVADARKNEIDAYRRRLRKILWGIAGVLGAGLLLVAMLYAPERKSIDGRGTTAEKVAASKAAPESKGGKITDPGEGGQTEQAPAPTSPLRSTGAVRNDVWLLPENPTVPSWMQPILMILLACLIVLFVWLRRVDRSLREVLQRRASDAVPAIRRMLLGERELRLMSPSEVVRIARSFRKWMAVPSDRLNVPATVSRTVAGGGRFAPVFGTYQSRPEYLFLIERASAHDQAAEFLSRLVDHLRTQGVLARSYYYTGDPRTCYPTASGSKPRTLRQLAYRFPDARLVVCGSAAGFFSPWTGEMEPWVDWLRAWEARVVLAPEAVEHWDRQHRELQKLFILLPASAEGFSSLTDCLENGRPYSRPRASVARPLPAELLWRPHVWIAPMSPPPEKVDRVLAALRESLGDAGYYWLSACAVFPSTQLNLTLRLGDRLQGGNGKTLGESRTFLQLASLPWFRHGYLPDWLRERLIRSLTPQRNAETRAILNELVVQAEQKSVAPAAAEMELDIAVEGDADQGQGQEPPRWRLFGGAKRNGKKPPAADKGRDYLFHTFMSSRSQDVLAFPMARAPVPLAAVAGTGVDRTVLWLRNTLAVTAILACLAYPLGGPWLLALVAGPISGIVLIVAANWRRYALASLSALLGLAFPFLISRGEVFGVPPFFEERTGALIILASLASLVVVSILSARSSQRSWVSWGRLVKASLIVNVLLSYFVVAFLLVTGPGTRIEPSGIPLYSLFLVFELSASLNLLYAILGVRCQSRAIFLSSLILPAAGFLSLIGACLSPYVVAVLFVFLSAAFSFLAYRRILDSTFSSLDGSEAGRANPLAREAFQRRLRQIVGLMLLIAMLIIGVSFGTWAVMDGPKWINQNILRPWQEQGPPPAAPASPGTSNVPPSDPGRDNTPYEKASDEPPVKGDKKVESMKQDSKEEAPAPPPAA